MKKPKKKDLNGENRVKKTLKEREDVTTADR